MKNNQVLLFSSLTAIFILSVLAGSATYQLRRLNEARRAGVVKEGTLKRRGERELAWEKLKLGDSLSLGDVLRTEVEGATVELKNGKILSLHPKSLVRLERIGAEQVELAVLGGEIVEAPYILLRRSPGKVEPVSVRPFLAAPGLVSPTPENHP